VWKIKQKIKQKNQKWEFETEKKLKSEILFFRGICSNLFDSIVQLKSEASLKILLLCIWVPRVLLLLKSVEVLIFYQYFVTAATAEIYFFYLHFQVLIF